MIPNMIGGGSFLEGEDADLYEGLSPREINELLFKAKFGSSSSGGGGGISSGGGGGGFSGGAFSMGNSSSSRGGSSSISFVSEDDPFEGMSPEEIDAMFAKQQGSEGSLGK